MDRLLLSVLVLLFPFGRSAAQISLNVDLLDHWNDTLVPNNGMGATYNETWAFVHGGEEYAVIGSTLGAHLFRITATDELEYIQLVPGAFQGPVIHRDYHDHAGYLYAVCDQGASSLQIMDLQYLPDSVHVVYDSADLVTTAHNIFIDTATARMYVCGPAGFAMLVLSLADPVQPVPAGVLLQQDYIHDAFVRNDTAYLNAAGQGLWVYDMTDPAQPIVLGSLTTYPDQGYNHSGWLSADGGTYVFADETEGMRMKVCDVNDLSDINVLGLFNSGETPTTIPHNLMLRDDLVYVSHYNDGLQIFDISDPMAPQKVGFYDTYPFADTTSNYRGAWGVYAVLPSGRILISDRQSGLYLLHYSPPTGVEERPGAEGMAVWPVPARERVQVQVDGTWSNGRLALLDAAGRTLLERVGVGIPSGGRLALEVGDLAPGLYVLRLAEGLRVATARIVVE